MGKKLKPVPEGNKGLKKLPTEVRNKMGFMRRGGKVGKTTKEVNQIIGSGARYPTRLLPIPKEGHKWCPCCFKELPFSEFHDNIDKNGIRKKRSSCKCCKLEQDRKRREARKNK